MRYTSNSQKISHRANWGLFPIGQTEHNKMINPGYRFDFTLILLALLLTFPVFADSTADDIGLAEPTTVDTLSSLIAQKEVIDADISTLNIQLKNASSDSEKEQLKIDLDSKGDQAQKISRSIENLAASTDLSSLRAVKEEVFNLEKELFSLIEPSLKEMRHLTYNIRVKADLRDRIEYVNERIPVVTTALVNINQLKVKKANTTLAKHIDNLKNRWTQQLKGYETELNSATIQLEKFELDEQLRKDNEPNFFKTFFEKRGWVLLKALGSIIFVILISKFIHRILSTALKGFQRANRSVRYRIIDLVHRGVTIIFIILAPVCVFYIFITG